MSATDETSSPRGVAPSRAHDEDAVVAFVMEAGRALLAFGAPTPAAEDAMTRAARAFGVEAQVFALPTMLQAAFGPPARQRHAVMRFDPGGTDLGGRVAAEEIVEEAVEGRAPLAEATTRLAALAGRPFARPAAARILAAAVAAGAATRFFGGGAREVGAAAVIAGLSGALEAATRRMPWFDRVFPCAAALAASALAALATRVVGPSATALVVVGALIVLLPGLSITTAVGELAARQVTAGTARLAYGLMTLFLMAFGVAVGRALDLDVDGASAFEPAAPPAAWSLAVATAVAPLSFAVLLNAKTRDFAAAFAGGVTGFLVGRAASARLGPAFGAFVGAFVVALAANAWSRVRRRPATIVLTPGFLMLVPGSVGFRSLDSLVRSDVDAGVLAAFHVALIAVAVVTGLFLALQVLPPRDLAAASDAGGRRAPGGG